jgi:hypothetical protein
MKEKSIENTKFKPTKRDYLNLLLFFVFLFVFFYFLINYILAARKEDIKLINSNYGFVKAKIAYKTVYKGKSLTVEYVVNGVKHRESVLNAIKDRESSSSNIYKLEVGDSILVKYSKTNPELIMIDLK